MRPKVKFEKGKPFVKVAYKNGEVTWALNLSGGKFEWLLFEFPENYNPARVTNDHKFILNGKKLKAQLLSTAAATHSFGALAALKKSATKA
jgi:hypothetical protein